MEITSKIQYYITSKNSKSLMKFLTKHNKFILFYMMIIMKMLKSQNLHGLKYNMYMVNTVLNLLL